MAITTGQQATAADVKAAVIKVIEFWMIDKLQEVDTITGIWTFRAPSTINGYILKRAQAYVEVAGLTNSTTVQVRNLTKYPANDCLSTAISIASGARVGTPGTVNAAYDDVATDNEIKVYVTAQSTTKPKGLLVALEYGLP